MLLVLLIGPILQIYDCFNDAPNVDHDALLHTVDALLSIAVILALSCLLFCAVAVSWFFGDLPGPVCSSSSTSDSSFVLPAFRPQRLSLRI